MNHLDGCPAELKCVCVCVCERERERERERKRERGDAGWEVDDNIDISFLNPGTVNFPSPAFQASCPWTFILFSLRTNEILLVAGTHGTQ